jgi:hypothetical protein
VSDLAREAVMDRASGEQPGRARALIAAIVIGAGAAVLAYRLLRSGGDGDEGDGDGDSEDG